VLLSGERERDRLDRAVAAAIEAGGGVDSVAELWAIVEMDSGANASELGSGADGGRPSSYVLVRAMDNGVAAAALLVQTWPLSELRQIDGLGLPAENSLEFALSFSGAAVPFLLRTDNPRARARFLWGISQLFAHKMRRKPPTTGLLLLDVQQIADDSGPATNTYVGQGGQPRRDLVEARERYAGGVDDESDDISGAKSSAANVAEPGVKDLAARDAAAVRNGVRFDATDPKIVRTVSAPNPSAAVAACRASRPFPVVDAARKNVEEESTLSRGQNAKTGGTRVPEFGFADYGDTVDGPVAIRRQPASAAGVGDARARKLSSAELRKMNIDQRAFLVAASRLGGLNDDDGVEVLLERRRRELEKRAFHLSPDEARDFDTAVSYAERESGCPWLSGFENWLEAEIARLEVVNITETLAVEQDAPALFEPLMDLKEALSSSDGWFRKSEARLNPHAVIVDDIRVRHNAIKVQRRNIERLRETLSELLEGCVLKDEEQSEIELVVSALSERTESGACVSVEDPFFSKVIRCALGPLARKANQSSSPMSKIAVVAESRSQILAKQEQLSALMLFSLEDAAERIAASWKVERTGSSLTHFANAAYALVTLDPASLDRLQTMYEGYVAQSSSAGGLGSALRDAWAASKDDGLSCQLKAAIEAACRLCEAEGNVVLAMFLGAARAAKVSISSVVESVLTHQFAVIASVVDDLVDGAAATDSVTVHWMAFLEVQARVDNLENGLRRNAASSVNVSNPSSSPELSCSSAGEIRALSVEDHLRVIESLNSTQAEVSAFDSVTFLIAALRDMAEQYRRLVDMEVGSVIGALPTRAADAEQSSSPELVFVSVCSLLKVCFEIVDAWTNSEAGATEICLLRSGDGVNLPRQLLGVTATKSMCDRLIAAAFKRIENSAVHSHQRSGMTKLECYTHISQRLFSWTEANVDAIFDDALNLSLRGRQHATRMYTSRAMRTYLGAIEDASRAPIGDVRALLHSALRLRGGPRNVLHVMRRDMMEAMSSAAKVAHVDSALWESCVAEVRVCLNVAVERLQNRDAMEEEAASLKAYRDEILL
jgi:hypothetical protein